MNQHAHNPLKIKLLINLRPGYVPMAFRFLESIRTPDNGFVDTCLQRQLFRVFILHVINEN